ncbi:pentapeptide repeat-containing protein [Actinopolymorpha sp. NPDC004070]|uniref:pentapeptide repeat-containing protein n=1 Tax=Actinopolymorpha sp. NPDC004070 TaxID=3154548 RepID=UPI0033B49A4A
MEDPRHELRADCARCFALCCVVPAFAASADFAIDKPARTPCPHLEQDFRCGIHDQLRPRGFPGCTAFDCLGAGQQVAQVTFGGRDWRAHPDTAQPMFDAFVVMRQLQEFRWYLTEALALAEELALTGEPAAAETAQESEPSKRQWESVSATARALREELLEVYDRTERHTHADAGTLRQLDLDAHRSAVNPLLRRTSELVRAQSPASARRVGTADPAERREPGRGRGRGRRSRAAGPGRADTHRRRGDLRGAELPGADLLGADLRDADLRAADLRGGYLIGADLRGANLARADLIGADLRAADLRGAHLGEALFLTRTQLAAANGDSETEVPPWFTPPAHWLR